jgi:hypothetical protein
MSGSERLDDDNDGLSRFGEFLMANLRDRCIDDLDRLAAGAWRAPSVQALQADLATLSADQRALLRRCVLRVIDGGIHDLLFALQESTDQRIAVLVDGKNICDLSDAVHGEPFGPKGWQARFSRYGEADDD